MEVGLSMQDKKMLKFLKENDILKYKTINKTIKQ